MKKFFNVLLKIILTLSFAGILITVGIVIVNNQNIAYEAYSYIGQEKDKTDFETLEDKARGEIVLTFGSTNNPYAQIISDMVDDVNAGVDYFLDFLSLEGGLSKGEQDKLINLYSQYLTAQKDTNMYCDSALEMYEIALNSGIDSEYAKVNFPNSENNFIMSYVDMYNKGSNFFKYLVEIVNKYSLNSSHQFVYKAQCHIMKIGFADYTIKDLFYKNGEFVKTVLERKKIENSQIATEYSSFRGSYNNFSGREYISNENFYNFINNVNALDIYQFAGNYNVYYETLKGVEKQKAKDARVFFENNF